MLTDKIKVLLADDQTMIRQGFRYVIGLQSDMQLIGEASDGKEAVDMAIERNPVSSFLKWIKNRSYWSQ